MKLGKHRDITCYWNKKPYRIISFIGSTFYDGRVYAALHLWFFAVEYVRDATEKDLI